MRVLLYEGKSLVSRIIQFQTRSRFSHAAIQMDSGLIVEAWHIGGVRPLPSVHEGHTPGTKVSVFDVTVPFDTEAVDKFLADQIGKRYDFWSVARFLTRRDSAANDRWFCSELVMAAFLAGGAHLLHRIPPSHTTPRDLWLSPYLRYHGLVHV